MSKHPKYIFPLRLLQKILLIGVVQALMSAVGTQMTKETGTSAANACSLQRSCGRSGRTCYMVFCNLRVQNIDISTMTWTVSRAHRRGEKSEGVIYTLSICSSSLALPVSPDHMGKMGLLKALFFCEPAAGPSARIPGHKPNLFLLLHLFLSSFLHISSETKDSMDGRRRKGV